MDGSLDQCEVLNQKYNDLQRKYEISVSNNYKVVADIMSKYEDQLLDKKVEIEKLDKKIKDLSKEISSLNIEVENRDYQINELKTKIAEMENDSKRLPEISTFLSDITGKYINYISDIEKEIEEKNSDIKVLESKKTTLEGNISDCESKIKGLVSDKTALEKNISDRDSKIKSLESKKTTLEKNISDCESKIKDLESEKTALEKNISDRDSKIKSLESDKDKLEKSLSEKIKDNGELASKYEKIKLDMFSLNKEKEELIAKNSKYEKDYEHVYNLQKLYNELSDKTKESLKGIFGKGDSIIEIIIKMSQDIQISSLYNSIAYRINNGQNDEIDKLKEIFDISFRILQQCDENYVRLDVKVDQPFNTKYMKNIVGSPTQLGVVQQVLFQGYKYEKDSLVSNVKHSLVILKQQ